MLILNLFLKDLGVVIKEIMLHTLKNIKNAFLAVLLAKLFVLMIDLANQLFFTDENLKLTKHVPVILHKWKGYVSHLTMQEIGKYDVKVNVVPNGLEKCMAFTINNNLVFIDSMQFMNSSLDTLVKNLSDNFQKNLSEELNGDLLELAKQKRVHLYEYIDSFKKFSEDKCKFVSSLRDKCISEKDYLDAINVYNVFKIIQ